MVTVAFRSTYGSSIAPSLWERLVARVAREERVDLAEAERVVDAALGFLLLCADYPGVSLAPSRQVDVGWHVFLMYTREYALFCEEHAGRFIHHAPNDDEASPQRSTVADTVAFMLENGIVFDPAMWEPAPSVSCSSSPPDCGQGDCNADGTGGNN